MIPSAPSFVLPGAITNSQHVPAGEESVSEKNMNYVLLPSKLLMERVEKDNEEFINMALALIETSGWYDFPPPLSLNRNQFQNVKSTHMLWKSTIMKQFANFPSSQWHITFFSSLLKHFLVQIVQE